MEQTTHHYHLVTGEIVFRHKKSDDVNAVRVNGILADAGKQIPVRLLAKAQQILQANFFKRMESELEAINVLDCVMTNFTYLGQFTPEEFHKEPEGMKVQEQQAPAAPAPSSNLRVMPMVTLEEAVAEAEK